MVVSIYQSIVMRRRAVQGVSKVHAACIDKAMPDNGGSMLLCHSDMRMSNCTVSHQPAITEVQTAQKMQSQIAVITL